MRPRPTRTFDPKYPRRLTRPQTQRRDELGRALGRPGPSGLVDDGDAWRWDETDRACPYCGDDKRHYHPKRPNA